jgi:glucokinase
MRYAIGVDLGGTEIRAGLVSIDGALIAHDQTFTAAEKGPTAVIDQIEALVRRVSTEVPAGEILGIGVGSPGPLDPFEGIVLRAPTLRGWIDVPLRSLLSSRIGQRVEINNDANVAALGEQRFGAGTGCRNLVYVAVGTGIGGGVIIDGKLLLGRKGLAAEIGHMSITDVGPTCSCGNAGCWEALASGTSIARFAEEAVPRHRSSVLRLAAGRIEARHVAAAAERGDKLAQQLLLQEARYLGIGITNLLHLFSPDLVVVGGGVGRALPLMHSEIAATVARRAMTPYRDVGIVAATLGPRAGVIGAATLVMDL